MRSISAFPLLWDEKKKRKKEKKKIYVKERI